MDKAYRIAVIGWGTVGGGVIEILQREGEAMARRCGRRLELAAVVTRHPQRPREQTLPAGCQLSDDLEPVLTDAGIETVLLLVGGSTGARDICLRCLAAGKHVVTANKAILAEYWDELFACADEHGVCLAFESAVAGGVPVIASLRDGLVASRIDAVQGILNGTCNYILTMMEEEQLSYAEALEQAKELGYAEADPTLDVNGTDTAHKIAILARLAFQTQIDFSQVTISGIDALGPGDLDSAARLGCRIKLLGIAQRFNDGVAIAAAPTLVPLEHPLASVRLNYNAVNFVADAAGPNTLIGQGAGAEPTASAVLADTVAIACGLRQRSGPRSHGSPLFDLPVIDDRSEKISFYVRLLVADQPGILAQVCQIFGEHAISIRSLHQGEPTEDKQATIEILTHTCAGTTLQKCIRMIKSQVAIHSNPVVLEHV